MVFMSVVVATSTAEFVLPWCGENSRFFIQE